MMINTCIFAYPVGRTFLTEITEGKEAEDDKLETPVSHSHKSFQLSFITFLLTIFPLYTTWLFRLARVSLYRRFDLRLVNNVIITFYLADFFLMRRALHFATKLNSRYIKKCHCFWVPSNDMFASARKAVFPAPITTAVHRFRNTWPSLREEFATKKLIGPFWTKVWTPPPPPQSKIPGSAPTLEERFEFPFNLIGKSTITFLKGQSWRLP